MPLNHVQRFAIRGYHFKRWLRVVEQWKIHCCNGLLLFCRPNWEEKSSNSPGSGLSEPDCIGRYIDDPSIQGRIHGNAWKRIEGTNGPAKLTAWRVNPNKGQFETGPPRANDCVILGKPVLDNLPTFGGHKNLATDNFARRWRISEDECILWRSRTIPPMHYLRAKL